tara:strand:+ start:306 stop:551 length:246 start_codon:yes stop_codon:yes gene_type:complete
MKEIIAILMKIGKPIVTKSGKGLFLINPKPFDVAKLESLASSNGLAFIHTVPRNGDETLYIGYAKSASEEDMLAALQLGKS